MHSQQMTKDFILRQLESLPPDGLVEVSQFIEFLQFQAKQPAKRLSPLRKLTSFGIWADQPEAQDPAAFSQNLRQKVEKRQDA